MSPQTKLQWIAFCVHTAVVYILGRFGPRLIIELIVDIIVAVLKFFIRKEKTK